MKIAFIIATLQNGGAERVLVSLANEFCKNCEIKIIKFDNLPSFYELDKGVLVEDLPAFKFTNLYHKIASRFKKFFALRKALKESKADIFISFLDSTNIACIMANFGLKTPLIISEHSTQGYLKPKIWRLLRRLFYPYCDALTVLSSKDRAYYESFVKNVKLLLNPCHFTPCLNLKKENVVLFVGRLDKNKNCAMFLRAVANLPPSLQKEYEFIIAGEGEERKKLEKLALDLKINVNFLGRIKNIEALYKRAKIICLCSFVEGLPTVLIESLFFEVARISTDYENSARDLIDEGKDGFLVPCDEARAMSEKLTLLMQDEALRLSLAKNATKRSEDFGIETVVKQWFELINEVLKNNAKIHKNLKENSKKPEFNANSSDFSSKFKG